jgi:hypothetical protein
MLLVEERKQGCPADPGHIINALVPLIVIVI